MSFGTTYKLYEGIAEEGDGGDWKIGGFLDVAHGGDTMGETVKGSKQD